MQPTAVPIAEQPGLVLEIDERLGPRSPVRLLRLDLGRNRRSGRPHTVHEREIVDPGVLRRDLHAAFGIQAHLIERGHGDDPRRNRHRLVRIVTVGTQPAGGRGERSGAVLGNGQSRILQEPGDHSGVRVGGEHPAPALSRLAGHGVGRAGAIGEQGPLIEQRTHTRNALRGIRNSLGTAVGLPVHDPHISLPALELRLGARGEEVAAVVGRIPTLIDAVHAELETGPRDGFEAAPTMTTLSVAAAEVIAGPCPLPTTTRNCAPSSALEAVLGRRRLRDRRPVPALPPLPLVRERPGATDGDSESSRLICLHRSVTRRLDNAGGNWSHSQLRLLRLVLYELSIKSPHRVRGTVVHDGNGEGVIGGIAVGQRDAALGVRAIPGIEQRPRILDGERDSTSVGHSPRPGLPGKSGISREGRGQRRNHSRSNEKGDQDTESRKSTVRSTRGRNSTATNPKVNLGKPT